MGAIRLNDHHLLKVVSVYNILEIWYIAFKIQKTDKLLLLKGSRDLPAIMTSVQTF